MKRIISIILAISIIFSLVSGINISSNAASNPYPTTQDVDNDGYYEVPCTRYAWQYVYDNMGIALPAWGHGGQWFNNAKNSGYSTGTTAKANSLAVWQDGGYGHVAFVKSVSGSNITIAEGGRTDLDTTSSHGICTSYTVSGTVGSIRPTNNKLIGYVYLNGSSGNDPQGCVDVITGGTGTVHIRGWAFDKDNKSASLAIHVYIGGPAGSGAEVHAITANKSRPDVNKVYGVGDNHGFDDYVPTSKTGSQKIYIYAINTGAGNNNPQIGSGTVNITKDTTKPTISNVKISNVTLSGYTVTFTATDNVGIQKVQCPTWTLQNSQDDLNWNEKVVKNGNNYSCTIKTSEHNNETGIYATHIYVYDYAGNYTTSSLNTIDVLKTAQETCSHTFTSKVTKAATCIEPGEKVLTCSKCKLTRTVSIAGQHKYNSVVTKPSANKVGYTVKTCTVCGNKETSYYGPTGQIKNVKCVARTSRAEKFTWKAIKGVDGYQVRLLDASGKEVRLKVAKTNVYTYTDLKVPGYAYKVQVRTFIKAVDGNYYFGPWSEVLDSPTLPAGTSITKLTRARRAFTAQWKKGAVTGYQIQYARNSKFSGAKLATIKDINTLKYTVKNLSAYKYYYVRIRTYKTINDKNYFSAWSAKKSVKTK